MSQKYDLIAAEEAYGKFLKALGFEWENNPHMKDTPHRVAKAWVHDLARGCFENKPKITAFENDGQYDGMVCQTNIPVISMCAHHNLPFMGYAHVAYIPAPEGKVIGLSKLNRIVDHICRRPSVQENITKEINDYISNVCEGNNGVATMLEANHTCCSLRGIKHQSTMRTCRLSGDFLKDGATRTEFYKFVEFAQNNRSVL
jgi:GTP cyclohydrolase I